MKTLVVASAGGHITEACELEARLFGSERLWVTYDVPQTRHLLADETVVFAHHPTTKHLHNALRNHGLARRVFAEYDIDRVVSTGAAVAVPMMLRASRLGIPCHYIESATRTDGPSLSGRMLQRLRRVHLYRQLGTWGEPRWRQGPCVFDGLTTASAEATRPLRRVVVSLGTHRFPFTALVERLAPLLRRLDCEVVWQLGSSLDPGKLPGDVASFLPADELSAAIAEADVVIGHAGVGLTLTALRAGKVPVLVPRRRGRREHTDDHQLQLARELAQRDLALTASVSELSLDHLERATELTVSRSQPPPFDLVD